MKKKYEHYQKADGVPVYLKNGISDKAVLGTTLLLIGTGLANGYYTIITMAFPKYFKK